MESFLSCGWPAHPTGKQPPLEGRPHALVLDLSGRKDNEFWSKWSTAHLPPIHDVEIRKVPDFNQEAKAYSWAVAGSRDAGTGRFLHSVDTLSPDWIPTATFSSENIEGPNITIPRELVMSQDGIGLAYGDRFGDDESLEAIAWSKAGREEDWILNPALTRPGFRVGDLYSQAISGTKREAWIALQAEREGNQTRIEQLDWMDDPDKRAHSSLRVLTPTLPSELAYTGLEIEPSEPSPMAIAPTHPDSSWGHAVLLANRDGLVLQPAGPGSGSDQKSQLIEERRRFIAAAAFDGGASILAETSKGPRLYWHDGRNLYPDFWRNQSLEALDLDQVYAMDAYKPSGKSGRHSWAPFRRAVDWSFQRAADPIDRRDGRARVYQLREELDCEDCDISEEQLRLTDVSVDNEGHIWVLVEELSEQPDPEAGPLSQEETLRSHVWIFDPASRNDRWQAAPGSPFEGSYHRIEARSEQSAVLLGQEALRWWSPGCQERPACECFEKEDGIEMDEPDRHASRSSRPRSTSTSTQQTSLCRADEGLVRNIDLFDAAWTTSHSMVEADKPRAWIAAYDRNAGLQGGRQGAIFELNPYASPAIRRLAVDGLDVLRPGHRFTDLVAEPVFTWHIRKSPRDQLPDGRDSDIQHDLWILARCGREAWREAPPNQEHELTTAICGPSKPFNSPDIAAARQQIKHMEGRTHRNDKCCAGVA